jgi:TolA-binding protein
MNTAVVALIVGLTGAAVSFMSAVAAWRKDHREGTTQNRSLALEELERALAHQGVQIDRQDQRIRALEQEVDECHLARERAEKATRGLKTERDQLMALLNRLSPEKPGDT